MENNLSITEEKKLLFNILFSEKKISHESFTSLDYGKIVKIASSNLMLPALYHNLKIGKYLNFVPEDFKNYLFEIYNTNYHRNLKLIEEVNYISEIFNKKNIRHVFIKGAGCILSDIYLDIGERMVGDIDVLVEKKKSYEAVNLLEKKGYKTQGKIFLSKLNRHHVRQVCPKKLFAIEIHREILKYPHENLLNVEELLREIKKINNVNVPTYKNQLLINLYNSSINDSEFEKLYVNSRTIYDHILINKKAMIKTNSMPQDKFSKRFLLILKNYGLIEKLKLKLYDEIIILRINLKLKYKFYCLTEDLILKLKKKIMTNFHKILTILKDRDYLIYTFGKIFNKKGSQTF